MRFFPLKLGQFRGHTDPQGIITLNLNKNDSDSGAAVGKLSDTYCLLEEARGKDNP